MNYKKIERKFFDLVYDNKVKMRDISNAVKRAFEEIKSEIKKQYEEGFDLEKFIEDLCDCCILDFNFTKAYEPLLALEYIDRYCGDKFEHDYDIDVVEAMFCWVVANNFKDILQQYVEELKEEISHEVSN